MKERAYNAKYPPIVRLGEMVEIQFDEMDRDLSHIRPRQIREYNAIVSMMKLMPKKGERK